MSFSASINEIVSHGLRTPADPSVYVCSEFLLLYMVHTNAGAYFGDSTQLLYLRARYYNPTLGRFQTRDTWEGNYNKPLSLNHWPYVEGNPINYTDPSGHCKSDDANCWVMVNRLEKAYPFIDLRNGIANDVNAYWNVGELLAVEMDLQRLDSAATTDLNQIFSPQEIKMVRLHANSLKAGQDSCGEFTTGNKTVQKGIYITDHYINDRQMCDGTIEHELAHWWDRKYDVSSDFQEYTGGFTLLWFLYFPGPGKTPLNLAAGSFNRKEDFAGSFEEYIILSKGGIESTGIEVGEKRWLFIDTLLRTGTSPSQTSQVSPLPYCWTWMPYDM